MFELEYSVKEDFVCILINRKNENELFLSSQFENSLQKINSKFRIAITSLHRWEDVFGDEQLVIEIEEQKIEKNDCEPRQPENPPPETKTPEVKKFTGIVQVVSKERKVLTPAIVFLTDSSIGLESIVKNIFCVLERQEIEYAEQKVTFCSNNVQILDKQGQARQVPFETELIVSYEQEKVNFTSMDQSVGEIVAFEQSLKVDFKLVIKTIQDERKSKLSQQGVKLNV